MTSRPWHKRWHDKALGGMRGLSLELRGAYNTLLDLMYDNEGPVRLDERRQSAEMDCDIRVFRRVIGALIQAEKIHLWSDGRTVYIVNAKVQEVLGGDQFAASTSAELTTEVRDKFGVANAELKPKSARKPNKNSGSPEKTPEKTAPRGEKREEEKPPTPLKGGQHDRLPEEGAGRRKPKRSIPPDFPSSSDVAEAQVAARSAGVNVDMAYHAERFRGWAVGKDARYADWPATWGNWVRRTIKEAPKIPSVAARGPKIDPAERWRRACRAFKANAYWNTTDDGPKPGKPGCMVPSAVLAEFGFPPPSADGADLFPAPAGRSAA